jgi:hypothetical protein
LSTYIGSRWRKPAVFSFRNPASRDALDFRLPQFEDTRGFGFDIGRVRDGVSVEIAPSDDAQDGSLPVQPRP